MKSNLIVGLVMITCISLLSGLYVGKINKDANKDNAFTSYHTLVNNFSR